MRAGEVSLERHLARAVGLVLILILASFSIGLTFGVFIGSAIQSTTGP